MVASIAYLGLGGNVGDREATLVRALEMIDEIEYVRVLRVSNMIETDPVGGPAGQGPYLNAAAEIETDLAPVALLAALEEVEAALGRDRDKEQRWGPRTCDLDVLLVGETVLATPDLTIPHPRMHERLFVLRPLAQIAAGAVHPVLHKTVSELLARAEADA